MTAKSAVKSRFSLRRGLSASEAAIYLDLGETKFREMVNEGRMPRPRLADGRRIWDIDDLDAAFKSLPVEGGSDNDSWSDFR